ncbi:L,D-transpeptidase [Xanthobacter sp. TB0136]|uniref:L,D-transpeptidase n=1 Tax=Xanthobacter sp. TB0136 TaxID=3459177 RepID=UPI0040399DAE
MMLRQPFLLAAFGASLLSAPAFAQGANTSGYGTVPPGYIDPYGNQGAGGQQGGYDAGLQSSELPPPDGYQQAPDYQGMAGGQAQPQGYQQQVTYPQSGDAYQPQAANGQTPAYDDVQRMYGQHYDQPYEAQQQQAAYGQPQASATQSYAAPPAGVYATDAAIVPGTDQAPSGPRIESVDPSSPVDERFRRQEVDYVTSHPAGTLIVDTPNTYLYYVLGNGRAVRYGIGVGREGFTWNGVEKVSRKAEWPDWRPPNDMIARQPYLPRFMAGGPGNPMGARALYLGSTIYRIHGTNEPQTIGKFVSSGCIRMLNNDAEDLYERVKVGAKVVILPVPKNTQTSSIDAPATTGSIPVAQR